MKNNFFVSVFFIFGITLSFFSGKISNAESKDFPERQPVFSDVSGNHENYEAIEYVKNEMYKIGLRFELFCSFWL